METKDVLYERIVAPLVEWYLLNARDLAWRHTKDPYAIWLSEIMLQQTRVEAVKEYYARFMAELPDVASLAEVDERRLLKLWEGLGYYNRARNLQRAAREIMRQGGKFPDEYAKIRALPGIGDYTAGAICSIAFGMPEPAVDGNVLRVMTRVLGDDGNIDAPAVKARIAEGLRNVYPLGLCSEFTQSLMELGACVCLPNGAPNCTACPLAHLCRARAENRISELPVRSPKRGRKIEERTVLVIKRGDLVALQRRPKRGLLAGLWQYPNLDGRLSEEEVRAYFAERGADARVLSRRVAKHVFTHIEWHMTGYAVESDALTGEDFVWVSPASLETEYPLPAAFRHFDALAGTATQMSF